MRISTSTMTNMATSSMGGAYDKYLDIMNKITSNKNFTKVSENPVGATKVLKLNDQLSKLDLYQSNIKAAVDEMSLAYDTLGAVNEELNRINELVIEASNATTTPTNADAIAAEIKERVESIVGLMNTKYLDNYIFSGTFVEKAPYLSDGNCEVTYQGSSEVAGDRNLTISENKTFTYNFTGEEIFGDQRIVDDEGNKIDFFSQMKELNTLLTADELKYDEIRDKLNIIQTSAKKITEVQGNVSANVSKLLSTQELNDTAILGLTEDKVELEEVDITKAASDLAGAQTALQASYLIGTNILGSVSLLDYL